jgi:hypothetical protein
MPERRFPPPWSVEEQGVCFVVKDSTGQKLAYVLFRICIKPIASASWRGRMQPARLIDDEVFVHVGFDASGISCCQRLTTPAIAAPKMGASQNSQSCAI